MRMRITKNELEYYARSKRENTTIRLQGINWRVIGITADWIPNASAQPTPGATQGEQQQWWVELSEAK
jgi:hypothetical protein